MSMIITVMLRGIVLRNKRHKNLLTISDEEFYLSNARSFAEEGLKFLQLKEAASYALDFGIGL